MSYHQYPVPAFLALPARCALGTGQSSDHSDNINYLDTCDHLITLNTFRSTMSIHWTLIAGFLYAEIGVILLLLVPFISTR